MQENDEFEILQLVAHLDGADDSKRIVNPIHSSEEAKKFGFEGALVGGVVIYGWALPCILKVLGEEWMSNGFCEVNYKAPIYPGDLVTIKVSRKPQDSDGQSHIFNISRLNNDKKQEINCVVGFVGLGKASWYKNIHTTKPPPCDNESNDTVTKITVERSDNGMISLADGCSTYSMANALSLLNKPLPPYVNRTKRKYLKEWYATRIAPSQRTWFENMRLKLNHNDNNNEKYRVLHPCVFVSGRCTPLLHHTFDYATSIHTLTKIQHLSPPTAACADDQADADSLEDDDSVDKNENGLILTAGKIVNVYEKKGKEYVDVHVQVFAIDHDKNRGTRKLREIARMIHQEILNLGPPKISKM